MEVDEWRGMAQAIHATSDPSDEDIKEAIRSLDAATQTIMTLHIPNSAHVMVAGGLSGQFVVAYGDENGMPFSVIGSSSPGNIVEMFVGGQQSEFVSENIVDAETAFLAAQYFAQTGHRNPALIWRED